jgi:hypothetical protein
LGLCLLVGLCLALGGQARPAHAQSTLINDTFATAPTDLNFNGSAYYDSAAQSGVLTDSFTYDQAGTIFSQSAFTLDAFSSSFQFRTGAGDFGERADGFAFVIQQMGSTAVGGSGAGLGFAGLGGYGAIFRTFNNPECGTGSVGNYAAVATGNCSGNPGLVTVLQLANASFALNDTNWHTAQVLVTSGQMSITVDGTSLLTNVPLPGYTPGQSYYVGFTGSTGGLSERAEVRNWTYTAPDGDLGLANVPANITTGATSPQGAVVTYTPPTTTDESGDSSTASVTCTPTSGSTFAIGTTTVTCTATDSDDANSPVRGSFQVVVVGASGQVTSTISQVNSFGLPADIQAGFDTQLQAVQTDLTNNNPAQACVDLTSFINHVQAQSGKHLTNAQANQLLVAARQVQAVLGC